MRTTITLKSIIHHAAAAIAILLSATAFSSCINSNDGPEYEPTVDPEYVSGMFILSQGGYGQGNSSLSFLDLSTYQYGNEIFANFNGFKLGDQAQSITMHGDDLWIVVSGSNVVFCIDAYTFKEKGRVTGLNTPRYIHFPENDPSKAYITQLYDNRIAIIDPRTYKVTGYIDVPDMDPSTGSTEMMVQYDKYVYVNCWSYQNRIIRIDTTTDLVDASLTVGIQPKAMVMDRNHNIWVLTDGGYEGSPYGYEQPHLTRIDLPDFKIGLDLPMPLGSYASHLAVNGNGSRIYWICNDVYTMPIESTELPQQPIIYSKGTYYYGLAINPENDNIYLADALDYVQRGVVRIYTPAGLDFMTLSNVGVCPQAFCYRPSLKKL